VLLQTVHRLGNGQTELVAKIRSYDVEPFRGSTGLSGRGATGWDAPEG
jgi:hypothetical protein